MAAGFEELEIPLRYYRGRRPQAASSKGQDYANPNFWDARFKDQEGFFDWYATYDELGDVFKEFCPPSKASTASADAGELLVVGCGNSAFSAELHQAGYRGIVNIDVSAAAIEKMGSHFRELGMQWLVMDATAMDFDADRFDVAVDKGTLDAMMSAESGSEAAMAMAAEVWRVLRPGGVFIVVSHNGQRMPMLRAALEPAVEEEEADIADSSCRHAWRCLELRRCRLSPQATLINILRSKLQGRPLAEAFRDPEMLREATVEAKAALKRMTFLDAFRLFKARKRAQAGEVDPDREADAEPQELPGEEALAGSGGKDPRLQPFCWVYALKKVLK